MVSVVCALRVVFVFLCALCMSACAYVSPFMHVFCEVVCVSSLCVYVFACCGIGG